jgi:hypothetical protein
MCDYGNSLILIPHKEINYILYVNMLDMLVKSEFYIVICTVESETGYQSSESNLQFYWSVNQKSLRTIGFRCHDLGLPAHLLPKYLKE